MIGRIALFLVGIGGAIGTLIRFFYSFESVSGEEIAVMTIIIVLSGGAIGSAMRFLISGYALPLSGSTGFPFGVLIANILACILFAVMYAVIAKYISGSARYNVFMFVAIGVAGGLSTFSSFALDVAILKDRKKHISLVIYILASLILCIGSIFLIFHFFPFKTTISFPRSTIEINIVGSFIMGIFIGLMARYGEGGYGGTAIHVFIASGILGGMTTFSAFAMDFVLLAKQNYFDVEGVDFIVGMKEAAIYGSISLFGCIFAFMIGLQIIRIIHRATRKR